jgi:RNA polymerase sigma-70 factor (ECF subfamily)
VEPTPPPSPRRDCHGWLHQLGWARTRRRRLSRVGLVVSGRGAEGRLPHAETRRERSACGAGRGRGSPAGQGGRRPLEELYRRYEARLYGLGLRLLSDQGLAEELVQETFVRLWQQARRFDPARGSVGSFLFAIARRLAVDLWRRPSSRPFEPELQDQPASSDPVENLIQGLTIGDALQTLSPHHRQVLELYLLEDRKQSEIAELLGLPLGTVKTRAYYALRAFKLALQERGIHA